MPHHGVSVEHAPAVTSLDVRSLPPSIPQWDSGLNTHSVWSDRLLFQSYINQEVDAGMLQMVTISAARAEELRSSTSDVHPTPTTSQEEAQGRHFPPSASSMLAGSADSTRKAGPKQPPALLRFPSAV